MVSLEERNAITVRAQQDDELRMFYAFLFEERIPENAEPGFVHVGLLRSIAKSDEQEFRRHIEELERRRITPESEWCQNDCLVFLLLLGCQKFSIHAKRVDEILAVRERNTNPGPQKVNDTFQALNRLEYGMDGEYCFLKIPFLHLLGRLDLSAEEACRAHAALCKPGLLHSLAPFDQLLALRAYDLILFERKPTKLESFDQLIEVIERDFEKVSLRQLFRLISATSVRSWLIVGSIALTVLGVLSGAGYKAGELWFQREASTERPQSLQITDATDATMASAPVLGDLAKTLLASHSATPGNKLSAALLQSSDFQKPTPDFSIELSHSKRSVIAAHAFLRMPTPSGEQLTILPVQNHNSAVRTLVPKTPKGARVIFMAVVEVPVATDASQMSAGFILRSLD